jgi:hypothetical protein
MPKHYRYLLLSFVMCMPSCDYWQVTMFTHTSQHHYASNMNAFVQKYRWQVKDMLKCLFSVDVYEGDSVWCDVEFKFDITSDNLYNVFQNSTCLLLQLFFTPFKKKSNFVFLIYKCEFTHHRLYLSHYHVEQLWLTIGIGVNFGIS